MEIFPYNTGDKLFYRAGQLLIGFFIAEKSDKNFPWI